MNKEERLIVCITPVKNESWILDKFLKSTSLWADYIVIADQNSEDGSVEIAKKYKKVVLIRNNSNNFNECERQNLLISEARKISKNIILIALDCDEFLTGNFSSSKEWSNIKKLKPGTIIKFDWVNIRSDFKKYWIAPNKMPFGFVDDGSKHDGLKIHSPRVPLPVNSPIYFLNNVKVMHFQYILWDRMESKHRWYQCWERINRSSRKAIFLYRQYHHMYSIKPKDLIKIPNKWFSYYIENKILIKNISSQHMYYWDKQVLDYFVTYGEGKFSRESIWDIDWNIVALNWDVDYVIHDPRNWFEHMVQNYLKNTQIHSNNFLIIFIDIFLSLFY